MITMDKEQDPFATKMIFLRIGWMDRYQGLTGRDNISSGGSYVDQHGFGHEIFNFRPSEGKVYGYVQPPGKHENWEDAKINITRLGASAENESISGVLAMWVATLLSGGAFVVGWYKNATVYRNWQPAPSSSYRQYSEIDFGYHVTASVEDAVLIPPDESVFAIPQK